MKVLGNPQRNRWCCFCKHWFDPACSALTPRPGGNLYDVDGEKKCKCECCKLMTKAIHTCPKFEKKM